MNKRDYTIAFIVGLASSVFWYFVLRNLSLHSEGELVAAIALIPFAFLAIVALAHRFFSSHNFHKAAKFLIVGVLNSGIDFFVFNMLIAVTGHETGGTIVLFKSTSFVCAMINSYELNRFWTFSGEAEEAHTRREFGRFAIITVVGFLVNVGTTTLIVAFAHPAFGLSQVRWDNVAAVAATALNLIWNFAGYKLFVFRSKDPNMISPNVI
ncbi:MAG TPA: GtrA family protein [Candidatus Paceibacterota bacterium]|nr:GtrA family protein [Candidatus Paceibacterota bacterium]